MVVVELLDVHDMHDAHDASARPAPGRSPSRTHRRTTAVALAVVVSLATGLQHRDERSRSQTLSDGGRLLEAAESPLQATWQTAISLASGGTEPAVLVGVVVSDGNLRVVRVDHDGGGTVWSAALAPPVSSRRGMTCTWATGTRPVPVDAPAIVCLAGTEVARLDDDTSDRLITLDPSTGDVLADRSIGRAVLEPALPHGTGRPAGVVERVADGLLMTRTVHEPTLASAVLPAPVGEISASSVARRPDSSSGVRGSRAVRADVDDGSLHGTVFTRTTEDGLLVARTSRGERRWTASEPSTGWVLVLDGHVISQEGGSITSRDGRSGEVAWDVGGVRTTSDLFTDGRVLVVAVAVARHSRQLMAYRLDDGTLSWSAPLADRLDLFAQGGRLYGTSGTRLVAFG